MAISNYSELKTAMADWSTRSDLSTYLDNMIVVAEARMLRDLRRSKELHKRDTLTVDAQVETLPADFAGMISIDMGTTRKSLDYLPSDSFHARYIDTSVTGEPIAYTIEGTSILFGPVPDQTFTANLVYVAKLDIATDTTNRLLTIYPDLYLWACLVALADFIHDDEMLGKYSGLYEQALAMMLEVDQDMGALGFVGDMP